MWSVNYALKALHPFGSYLVCNRLGELFLQIVLDFFNSFETRDLRNVMSYACMADLFVV